uniref:protein piccolo-like n=1 Tax=Jaculus jaculus TaxID=51337 RepID=UPI001E1B0359|nr:protein piccolo-like [Jaculus jaculus]
MKCCNLKSEQEEAGERDALEEEETPGEGNPCRCRNRSHSRNLESPKGTITHRGEGIPRGKRSHTAYPATQASQRKDPGPKRQRTNSAVSLGSPTTVPKPNHHKGHPSRTYSEWPFPGTQGSPHPGPRALTHLLPSPFSWTHLKERSGDPLPRVFGAVGLPPLPRTAFSQAPSEPPPALCRPTGKKAALPPRVPSLEREALWRARDGPAGARAARRAAELPLSPLQSPLQSPARGPDRDPPLTPPPFTAQAPVRTGRKKLHRCTRGFLLLSMQSGLLLCDFCPSPHLTISAYPTKVLTYSSTTSKVAYFKRKYAEEEDLHQDYHGYFPKHLILPEDRTCILRLSLEKLRFLEDPETYLRRSVLINNLLRKIHLETEKESYEYYKEASCCKTAYSDARKRLKLMVQGCYSQSLYYEELHSYHIVPYASENAIYGMGYTSDHLEQNSQLLIYKMN